MKPIRECHHRLEADRYTGFIFVAFTACVHHRFRLFTDDSVVRPLEVLLRDDVAKYHCKIEIYVFIPDHLHVLLSSTHEDGDPLSAMKRFKQRSNYWLAHHRPGMRWQKDFYDRIIRTPMEFHNQFRYILNNPVQAGIVQCWREYPYVGSTVHDIAALDV